MLKKKLHLALALMAVMAMVMVYPFAGTTTAQETPGGELGVAGELVDKSGDWVADFELYATEAPTQAPEYFPNGNFEEGETGDEWAFEALGLNRFGFGEEPLPEPFAEEFSLQMFPQGPDGTGFASVCLGWIDPGATYNASFVYFIDGLLGTGPDNAGLVSYLMFFEAPENPCDIPDGPEPVLVQLGPLTALDWTEVGFDGTAPANTNSMALAFELADIDGSAFLDNISVTGPETAGTPGIGDVFFSIGGRNLTACDTHGPSAEPGFEGILGDIGCGGSGGQAVSIDGCTATIETHGFVHSDAPNTTFLGQAVIDITLDIGKKGTTLDVEIYTPKDVIEISGIVPSGTDVFMSTCDSA